MKETMYLSFTGLLLVGSWTYSLVCYHLNVLRIRHSDNPVLNPADEDALWISLFVLSAASVFWPLVLVVGVIAFPIYYGTRYVARRIVERRRY